MEDFVDFDLAKKLKEKGFREKVNAYYGKHENIFEVHPSLDMNDNDYRCSAPTISQVLKWLRDKKIHLVVDIEPKGYFFIVNYNITTDFNDKYEFDIYNSWGCYYDYKQAALAGIEYVLNNLI